MWFLAAALISIVAFAQAPQEESSERIAIVGYVHASCPIPLDGTVSLTVPASGEPIASQPVGSKGRVAFDNVPRGTYQLRVAVRFSAEIDRMITPGPENTLDFGIIEIQRNMSCDVVTVTIPNPLPSLAPQSQGGPIDTTVCEVVNDPSRFIRRLVRFRADAYGTLIDNPWSLNDKGCPRAGIVFELPSDSKDYGVRRLAEALDTLHVGCTVYLGRSAAATVVGRPEYDFSLYGDYHEVVLVLKVEAVEDVMVPPPPKPAKSCWLRGRLRRLKRLFS